MTALLLRKGKRTRISFKLLLRVSTHILLAVNLTKTEGNEIFDRDSCKSLHSRCAKLMIFTEFSPSLVPTCWYWICFYEHLRNLGASRQQWQRLLHDNGCVMMFFFFCRGGFFAFYEGKNMKFDEKATVIKFCHQASLWLRCLSYIVSH